MNNVTIDTPASEKGYSDVNGIKMYYEIYGEGRHVKNKGYICKNDLREHEQKEFSSASCTLIFPQ